MSDPRPSALLLIAVRHRTEILRAGLLGAILGGSVALLGGVQYKATGSFLVQNSQASLDGLAGLASQFGVRVPRGATGYSPEFYRELLTSEPVLRRIAVQSFASEQGGAVLPLSDLVGTRKELDSETVAATVGWLRESALRASVARETGVVRLTVSAPTPRLAQALADSLMQATTWFEGTTRRSQARAEREFLAIRADSALLALRSSESALQSFLTKNRSFRDSPALSFEYDRLNRDVTLRQQIYTSLSQALEQARIEEVRTTPVLTIIENPSIPTEREPRGTVLKSLAAALTLSAAWTLAIILRVSFLQSNDSNIAEVRSLLKGPRDPR